MDSGEWLQWAIIIAYVSFIFVKGLLKGKKIHSSDDFLVAGRTIPWPLLFATLGATVIGGGYSIGAVGRTYEWGILMVLISMGGYLHFVFSGWVVAPQFRRAKLYTVAGYFGYRFDDRSRFIALILSLLFSVFIIAAQIAAIGSVLATLMGAEFDNQGLLTWAILIGGIIVIIYSTVGGLLAVIHTDVYQFIILFVGFLLTLSILMPDILTNWSQFAGVVPSDFFAYDGGKGIIFLVTTFLAFLLGETFAPGYATRYCIGKNIEDTKKGIVGVGLTLTVVFPAMIFFIALYAKYHFPDIDPQYALPMVIRDLHNPIFSGIMIAALLSAVMSSADSALNSSTTIFVKDLFEHQLKWKPDDRKLLRTARYCTLLLGGISTTVAMLWPNIIDLLLFTYHLWAPGIILPIVVGSLSKERGRQLNTSILFTMLIAVTGTWIFRFTSAAETFDPAVFGVFVSIVTYGILRLILHFVQPKR